MDEEPDSISPGKDGDCAISEFILKFVSAILSMPDSTMSDLDSDDSRRDMNIYNSIWSDLSVSSDEEEEEDAQKRRDDGFIEDEELELQQTLLSTIMSFVPGTKAYKQAKFAIKELNDLQKMQQEIKKCEEVLFIAKSGRHDEALEELMSETEMDYMHFNRILAQYSTEGRWNWHDTKFADLHISRSRKHYLLRREEKRSKVFANEKYL